MALKCVVGLFESRGIAEDAVNRLKYEGVPATNVFVLLMHETTAGAAAAMTPELAELEGDPFVVGQVLEAGAPLIPNCETPQIGAARTHGGSDLSRARGPACPATPVNA